MKKLKLLILIATIVLLAFVAYLALKILAYSDLSEYNPADPPKILKLATKAKVYLVSYADGADLFTVNQRALAGSAIQHGIKNIYNYDRSDLSTDFIQQNSAALANKTGAGLWLWKPYVILKTLETVPENSLVIYADSAFLFIKDVDHLLDLADKHKLLLVYYDKVDLYGKLGTIVRRSILEKTNCDSLECRNAPHIWAAFMVVKNTAETRRFIAQWLKLCEQSDLLAGPENTASGGKAQYPEYAHHQFDESLLTVVNYQENIGQYLLPASELHQHLLWHHRKTKDANYQYSLLPIGLKAAHKLRGFQRDFYNSRIMAWVRRWC